MVAATTPWHFNGPHTVLPMLCTCRRLATMWVFFQLLITLKTAAATCNEEQVTSCRDAAAAGQLDRLPAGGQCVVKQYVHYTHLCTVSNYEPGVVDYCCCHVTSSASSLTSSSSSSADGRYSSATDRLLCCRYHQDWYHFRCTESADDVSDGNDARHLSGAALVSEIALPVIVCLVIALLVVIACYVRGRCCGCCCYFRSTSTHAHSKSARESMSFRSDYDSGRKPDVVRSPPYCDVISHRQSSRLVAPSLVTSSSSVGRSPWDVTGIHASIAHRVEPSAPPDVAPPYSTGNSFAQTFYDRRGIRGDDVIIIGCPRFDDSSSPDDDVMFAHAQTCAFCSASGLRRPSLPPPYSDATH